MTQCAAVGRARMSEWTRSGGDHEFLGCGMTGMGNGLTPVRPFSTSVHTRLLGPLLESFVMSSVAHLDGPFVVLFGTYFLTWLVTQLGSFQGPWDWLRASVGMGEHIPVSQNGMEQYFCHFRRVVKCCWSLYITLPHLENKSNIESDFVKGCVACMYRVSVD